MINLQTCSTDYSIIIAQIYERNYQDQIIIGQSEARTKKLWEAKDVYNNVKVKGNKGGNEARYKGHNDSQEAANKGEDLDEEWGDDTAGGKKNRESICCCIFTAKKTLTQPR